MATVQQYLDLITSEHRKPKFLAQVELDVTPYVEMINLIESFPDLYDIDIAVGAQLDVIGLWVGISRRVPFPITDVYFSFDTPGLGWDEGVWQGPNDPDTGLVDLNDDDYRLLLKAKIGANHYDGTRKGMYEIFKLLFPDNTEIFILKDNQDMSIDIGIAGAYPSRIFLYLLVNGYIPFKPEGVRINSYTFTSEDGAPLFGFDLDNDAVAGWDTGTWGINTIPI